MKITNYETKNSVVTFLPDRSAIISVAFLMGMAAVVFGAMFVLSPPSFAQVKRGTMTLSTVVPTRAYNYYSDRSVLPYHKVTFPIFNSFIYVRTSGSVSGEGAGVSASLEGDLLFYFTNEANIDGLSSGIEVIYNGTNKNRLIAVNKGNITDTERWGFRIARTGAGGIEFSNKSFIGSRGKGVLAEHAGTGDIGITNESSIWGEDIGVHANHSGTGDIEITNKRYSWGNALAIFAEHDGEGNIGITNEYSVRVNGSGIFADHDGTGDIGIINKHLVWGGDVAIRADHTSKGDIVITNEGTVRTYYHTVRALNGTYSTAIDVDHISEGDILITNKHFVRDSDIGIHAEHADSGDIKIVNRGVINSDDTAIIAEHTGTGDIVVANENHHTFHTLGDISIRAEHTGIRAAHTGEGDIRISNKRDVSANDTAIHAEHDGTGDIVITNNEHIALVWGNNIGINAEHTGTGDIGITNHRWNAWGNNTGIHANHTGMGNIGIANEDAVHGYYGTGILAEHAGTGDIGISNGDIVWAGDIGINAEHTGTGDIGIRIDDGSTVSGRKSYGIEAIHTGTGEIEIDVSGTVLGGKNAGPINMVSVDTKTLILRPGFELKSGQDHVDIISAGTGNGILELNQDDDGTLASASLDFEDLNFQGFDEFAKRGENTWEISGVASDAERFDTATIWEGTLRFTGGSTFKMAQAETGADPNYFKIEDGAVLEVVGSNTLDGNLDNLGKISFTYDSDAGQNPASVLAVGSDYKGGGEVIFDVGSGSWQADELRIARNHVNPTEVTEVGLSGMVSNFVSSENEYLPMEIEVAGTANPGSFVSGATGGYDVNHHKYLLGHYPEIDEQGDITLHRWRFRRGEELSAASGQGFSYEVDLSEETGSDEEMSLGGGEGNSELGIREGIRRHEGGVWGRQQTLHTSAGPSVFAIRGSRKTDERVYFGYDTPAMGFMGGDMVVRTSVSHGLSISDVFSSSGRGRINMESDATTLTALWQSPGGFYASGRTRHVRSSGNISEKGFAVASDNKGVAVGASAKAGYRFAVPLGEMDFSVAPQVQLLWSSVDFDDFTGLTGEVVSLEDGELMTGRLGLLWDGEWQNVAGSGRIYGKMNLHHAVDGETTVSVSGVPLSRERSDLLANGHLGFSYEWNEGYAVRGEVSALHRDDAEEIRADFGMSFEF